MYSWVENYNGVHEFLNEKGENNLISRMGLVTLDNIQKKVHTQNVDFQTFATSKRYTKEIDFDRGYELAVLSNYKRNENRSDWLEGGKNGQIDHLIPV